jgi:hypothetical protein
MTSKAIFRPCLVILLLTSALSSCASNDSASDRQHEAQQRANHLRRLAWQKAHPSEWAAEKARVHAQELARAEAARRARAEAAERATAKAAYAAAHTRCKEFGRGIESISEIGGVVAGYSCGEIAAGIVNVHVTVRDSAWESADYDQRLRLAKGLWGMCVKYAHPDQADSCHVRLVGEGGEDLGGSNDFAGSMIDVSKD